MVARFAGAGLGLFAFSLVVITGLISGNPAELILSKAIWSLLGFCALGAALGWVVERVIDEYGKKRQAQLEREVQERLDERIADSNDLNPAEPSAESAVQEKNVESAVSS